MIKLVEHKIWWNDLCEPEIRREGVLLERMHIEQEADYQGETDFEDIEWRDCDKYAWDIMVKDSIGTHIFSLDEEWIRNNAVLVNPPLELQYNIN